MLDVHLPHKKIDGAGEFFLHLFTITIGLLIAVGIEAAVERHQHRELAAEARETMTAEIRKNEDNVTDALKDIDREQQTVTQNLSELRKVQLDPKESTTGDVPLDISYNTTGLEDTGWRTAQATGALAFMPYAEAEKFSSIYLAEEVFLKGQSQLADDESHMLGIIQKFHIGHGPLTKDAANAFAEQLGIWQGHLLNLKITARVLDEQQKAFLEGRAPQHHMSEKIGGV
jgi:plasmid stability protein